MVALQALRNGRQVEGALLNRLKHLRCRVQRLAGERGGGRWRAGLPGGGAGRSASGAVRGVGTVAARRAFQGPPVHYPAAPGVEAREQPNAALLASGVERQGVAVPLGGEQEGPYGDVEQGAQLLVREAGPGFADEARDGSVVGTLSVAIAPPTLVGQLCPSAASSTLAVADRWNEV